MRRIGDLTAGPLACLLLLGAGGAAPALAQEMPLSVIYGPAASTAEGDDDYRELIFLSVPADLEDRLYLRIFDPDTGGDHDLAYGGSEDTETRYALVGGAGALSAVAGSAAPSAEDLASGEPIREASVAASAALDGKWQTIASFLPDQGELVGDRRVFRLLVEGLAGNDANLYAATLSLRDRRNLAPDGLEVFAFSPTVRMPDDDSITELRFVVPQGADRLVLHNFDVANGEVTLTTALRSVPLAASGQNEWRESEVEMLERERGQPAAITFAGGEEIPNDATFRITDAAGEPVAIELPVRAWRPNARPVPVADVELLANCFSVALDASGSSDADDDGLSYLWDFGDGAECHRSRRRPSISGPWHVSGRASGPGRLRPGRQRRRPALRRAWSSARRSRSPATTWWWRRASRWPSTAAHRSPASGRSRAICGISMTAPRVLARPPSTSSPAPAATS